MKSTIIVKDNRNLLKIRHHITAEKIRSGKKRATTTMTEAVNYAIEKTCENLTEPLMYKTKIETNESSGSKNRKSS